MEFGNTFNEFDDISVDVTPHLKSLRIGFYVAVGGLILAFVFFYFKNTTLHLPQNYVFLPLITGGIAVIAAFHYSMKYLTFLNSFPQTNLLIFSSAGIKVPLFLFGIFENFKFIFDSAQSRVPVLIKWSEIEKIDYITQGKSRTPIMKIKLKRNGNKIRMVLIDKTLLLPRLQEIENYLLSNHADLFSLPRQGDLSGVLNRFKGLRLVAGSIVALCVVFIYVGKMQIRQSNNIRQDQDIARFGQSAINEALTWATPTNPAILSDVPAEEYRIEKWPNGQLKSKEPVVNGAINGWGQYWFENGQPYGEIPYLNGGKHGHFILYSEDGSIDQELSYKNGQPHGILIWYKPKQKWLYVSGKAVEQIHE